MFKVIFMLHVVAMLIGIVAIVLAKLPLPASIGAGELFVYGITFVGLILVGYVGIKVLGAYFRSAGGPRYSDTNLRGGDYRDAEHYYE